MSDPKYRQGDEVSMERWDSYERPPKRMGFCIVVANKRGICESGWMTTVRSLSREDRAEMTVDQNWLKGVSRVVA